MCTVTLSICAQVPIQRTDVHKTNASTSEYAHQTSSAYGEMCTNVQHQKLVKLVQYEIKNNESFCIEAICHCQTYYTKTPS